MGRVPLMLRPDPSRGRRHHHVTFIVFPLLPLIPEGNRAAPVFPVAAVGRRLYISVSTWGLGHAVRIAFMTIMAAGLLLWGHPRPEKSI